MKTEILNSKGSPIVLTRQEQAIANALQLEYRRKELHNALGFEIDITTLTAIVKSIVEQKFFQIAPADYLPVRVGNGAWATELLTYLDYSLAGDFETGLINTGSSNSKLAEADAGIEGVKVPINNWAKGINWSLFELKFAAQSGNWDVVTSKERSRKKNWDLGIQRVAFLGTKANSNVQGLLTQSGVTADTGTITEYIRGMTAAEFSTFVSLVVAKYRANCAFTAMPTHFIIPELDYNGLTAPVSSDFPVGSKLEYLEKAFKSATQNPNFKIKPLAYADQVNNADVSGLNKNRYTLLNYDEDSVRMDIPVDYTSTLQNTINGFNFQNVGYGQFTGAKAYRPLEMYYFDWAA